MLNECRGLEYVLEIVKVLNNTDVMLDAASICSLMSESSKIDVNPSYVRKILTRMTKIDILRSGITGYQLSRPINEIMVSNVLDILNMPEETSPIYKICEQIKAAVSLSSIDEFYEF